MTFNLNISFLNVNRQSIEAFNLVTSTLPVSSTVPKVITSEHISAADLVNHFTVCKSKVKVGFLVTHFPKDCTLSGLDSRFVMWWEDILLSKYAVTCEQDDATMSSKQQLVVNIVIQQRERLWLMDKFDYSIPIAIEPEYTYPDLKAACSVKLLQGHTSVTLHGDLIQCLEIENKLSTEFTLINTPLYGVIKVNEVTSHTFTLPQLANGNVMYTQIQPSKSDEFELSTKLHGFLSKKHITVTIDVEPNVLSNCAVVTIEDKPIVLTTQLLDASPLLEISSGEATYIITEMPTFGRLEKVDRVERSVDVNISPEPFLQFSHTDIVNEVILYFPPQHVSDERKDNFSYTLTSPGVQPADGVFTIIFNQSSPLSTPPLPKILGVNLSTPAEVSESILTVIVVVSCVSVCAITIVVTVLCLRRVQKNRRKQLAKQELMNSEPRLILTKENGAYKLLVAGGDEFPVTSYSSPSSPSLQIDGDRGCEVSCTVPQVRVTPLIDTDGNLYDLHDYVNCEDLPYCPPSPKPTRATEGSSSDFICHTSDTDDNLYCSVDQLPPIKKPNYPL